MSGGASATVASYDKNGARLMCTQRPPLPIYCLINWLRHKIEFSSSSLYVLMMVRKEETEVTGASFDVWRKRDFVPVPTDDRMQTSDNTQKQDVRMIRVMQ